MSNTLSVGEYLLEVQDDKIEISIVDTDGAIIEGGTFPLEQFRLMVAEFYDVYF